MTYISVLFVSEALRTNSALSNVVGSDGATTRDARRFPSDSAAGLYREFIQLEKSPHVDSRTHHYIDASTSAIYIPIPLAK
jgi:hypothetical protein